ncbi:MAG: universal stress protein [Isosphaeraceae bacterium]
MSCFRNILVGIDLSHCARLAPDALGPIVSEVFERSVWLARRTSGRLTFFSALNLTEELLFMLEEKHRVVVIRKIEDEASQVLAALVQKASEAGVTATASFVRGTGWLEIIEQVLRDEHDLVLVGTRDGSGSHHRPFGNTAKKLLRRCPCPVWMYRTEPYDRPLNMLVASDLSPVSETALNLAVCLGNATKAVIHLLHAVDYPVYHLWLTALPDQVGRDYHRRVLEHAEQVLHDQVEKTEYRSLAEPIRIHLADKVGKPDEVILKCIREYAIDVLVMGTIGRGGVTGIMIGNTAERLVPEVTCSILAVKPPGFRCPVRPPSSGLPGR